MINLYREVIIMHRHASNTTNNNIIYNQPVTFHCRINKTNIRSSSKLLSSTIGTQLSRQQVKKPVRRTAGYMPHLVDTNCASHPHLSCAPRCGTFCRLVCSQQIHMAHQPSKQQKAGIFWGRQFHRRPSVLPS